MFYAHFVLAKKGPLARIWLAAHWDKKLTKAHVFEINIESSVEGILQPKVKMALRTSGHLLLGIVRIYSRKAKYLLADCNEAFVKIKMAFRPGMVDLPEGNREAAVATITLPEVFHDFDSAVPDITIDMDHQVTLNQSRAEDITIKEDYGTLNLMADDGFDDMAFEDVEVVRDASNIDDGFDHSGLMFDNRPKEKLIDDSIQGTSTENLNKQNSSIPSIKDNVFPAEVPDGLLENDAGAIFEAGGLFDEPLGHVPLDTNSACDQNISADKPPVSQDDSDDDMYDMGPASMGAPSPPSSPGSPPPTDIAKQSEANIDLPDGPGPSLVSSFDDIGIPPSVTSNNAGNALTAISEMPPPPVPTLDHHPLGPNKEESFALAPLDTMIVQGAERTVKTKRKRKLIVDEVQNISGEEMKSQLSDTSDIVTSLDLAPPTKKLMHWKETGGVEKLFALPGHPISSKTLSRLYQRHLTTRSVENEDFGFEDDRIVLDNDLEQTRDEECSARKRRREMDISMPQDLTHIDPMHLDRPSYPNDQSMLHPLDIPNFIPQHSMFHNGPEQSQHQLMSPIMTPSHMMHSVLPPPDMTPLPHGSQLMHSPDVNVDHSSQLPTIPENMHEMPPQNVNDFNQPTRINEFHQSTMIEPVPQHLNINSVVENQGQSFTENQLSQSPSMDHLQNEPKMVSSCNEVLEPCINGPTSEVSRNLNSNDVDNPLEFNKDANSNHVDQNMPSRSEESNINEQMSPQPCTTMNESMQQPDMQNIENPLSVQKNMDQSDEDDDYGAPSSVGPICPEEQMADETYEQFEERILTKRTTHMLHIIHNQLDENREVRFSSLTRNHKRKQAAQKFYTFLVLKKQQAVELQQNGPYDDLIITKGPKFSAVYNAN